MAVLPADGIPAKGLLPLDLLAEVFPGVLDLAGRLTAGSLIQYRRDAKYYLTFCAWDLERARDPNQLRAWRQHMVDHTRYSPNTINRRLSVIRRLVQASAAIDQFDHAEAYKFALVEPVKRSALRHRLRPYARVRLSPEQIRAMCQRVDTRTLIGLRDLALLHVLASSGCRVSEVVTLQQAAVLAAGDHWMIEVIGKGKYEPRLAPLSHEAYDSIQRWLTARSEYIDCAYVFTTFWGDIKHPRATPLSRFAAYKRVRHYAQLEGLQHVKPHDLRRFLGTQLTERYGLRQAQLALGHSSPETTARHYVMDDLRGGMSEGLF